MFVYTVSTVFEVGEALLFVEQVPGIEQELLQGQNVTDFFLSQNGFQF